MSVKSMVIAFVLTCIAATAIAGVLSWTAPSQYVPIPPATVGEPIPAAKVQQIIYRTYFGSSSGGPWTAGPVTPGGATSATVPDPVVGATQWYTVEAFLDNQVSGKAVAVSKTVPFRATNPPAGLTIQ